MGRGSPAGRQPSTFAARIAALRRSGEDVLALAGVPTYRGDRNNVVIHCPNPGHEDRHPTCWVHRERGKAYCFSCGWSCGDVVGLHATLRGFGKQRDALENLESHAGAAIPPICPQPMPARAGKGRRPDQGDRRIHTATWTYTTADGTPAFEVRRFDLADEHGEPLVSETTGKPQKEFIQTHPGGNPAGLPQQFKDGLRPLYSLPMLLGAPAGETVIVVEGEKAADALIEAGYCATTSSGGASQAHRTDWTPLADRPVLLWPDNDEAGRNHMARVAGHLLRLEPPARVEFVDLSALDLPPGGDAADYPARRGS